MRYVKRFLIVVAVLIGLSEWSSSEPTIEVGELPEGSYKHKPLTSSILEDIRNKYGDRGQIVIGQVAYTVWCSSSNDTVELYENASTILRVAKDNAVSVHNVIHAPGAYPECWGSDGYRQVKPVTSEFVRFYQSLQTVYFIVRGDLKMSGDVYEGIQE